MVQWPIHTQILVSNYIRVIIISWLIQLALDCRGDQCVCVGLTIGRTSHFSPSAVEIRNVIYTFASAVKARKWHTQRLPSASAISKWKDAAHLSGSPRLSLHTNTYLFSTQLYAIQPQVLLCCDLKQLYLATHLPPAFHGSSLCPHTYSQAQLSVVWVKNKGVTPAHRAFSDCLIAAVCLWEAWSRNGWLLGEERKFCDSERILFWVCLHAIHSIHLHTTPSNISRAALKLRGAGRLMFTPY